MKEKWNAWAAQFQKNAVALSDLAADAAYGIGKKVEAEANVLKLRFHQHKQRQELDDLLRQLGELLYATHTGTPTDSDILLEKMQEIDRVKAQLDAMSAACGSKSACAEKPVCPVCGSEVESYARFCSFCGQALHEEL